MTVDLSYFSTIDGASGEQILAVPVVSHKVQSDIESMIAAGRPQAAIEQHAELFVQHEQWQWFDEYKEYLKNVEHTERANANREILGRNENEQPIYAEPKPLPSMPPRPPIQSGKEFLTSLGYYSKIFKDERASKVAAIETDVEGVVLNGDEESQTRLIRAIVILQAQPLAAIKKVILNATPETTTQELLTSLQAAIAIEPTILWKTADNGVTELSYEKAIAHAMQAGTKQSDMWGMDDAIE